jgi:hypothetical protein
MKTKFLFATVMLLSAGLSAESHAQTAFEWDYHGIGFEVSSDFNVQTNNESEFTAVSSDGIIAVTLMPWSDATVSLEDLAEATVLTAEQLATFDRAAIDGDAIDLGDLQGYFIVAATDDYHSYDFLLVSLLLDVQSSTNLVVAIGFMDGNEDEAIDILASIYPYDN